MKCRLAKADSSSVEEIRIKLPLTSLNTSIMSSQTQQSAYLKAFAYVNWGS